MAARLIRRIRTVGSSQSGLRTISSNVAVGEKNTPVILPNGEIAACGSATGDGTVAIEESSTREMSRTSAESATRDPHGKYHTSPGPGISGTAAKSYQVYPLPYTFRWAYRRTPHCFTCLKIGD